MALIPWLILYNQLVLLGRSFIACVASVSNRVIARKLERKQKKGFFCSCPSFVDEPREETLETQARSFIDFQNITLDDDRFVIDKKGCTDLMQRIGVVS